MVRCMRSFDGGREASVNDTASRDPHVIWANCIGAKEWVSGQPIQFVSPCVSDTHMLGRLGVLKVQ